jgi:CIC family chloride channel protein
MSDEATMEPSAAKAASVAERSDRQTRVRRRLFPHAIVVGLATGALAVLFRIALERVEELRSQLIDTLTGPSAPLILIGAATALVGVAILLVLRFCPEAAGSGIPHLRLTLREDRHLRWRRILPAKFLSGLTAIAGGLALGREGPTIQMGAALGAAWGDTWLGRGAERRSLLVTGASAGLAAAFNAPMAGILFAIEELRINIPDAALFATMIACICSDLLARAILGQNAVLTVTLVDGPPPLESLPFFVVLGVVAGGLAWAFNHSLVWAVRKLAFTSIQANVAKVVGAGVVLGTLGWLYPQLLGGGLPLTNVALAGQASLAWLAAMFAARFALSVASYGVGTAGGIFAPLLVLGGLLGLLLGELTQRYFPAAVPEPAAFAVVGMAAVFASVVRCPLTGIVLIIEMTDCYELILPLMFASFTASIVADELFAPPVYDALLENQLTTPSRF